MQYLSSVFLQIIYICNHLIVLPHWYASYICLQGLPGEQGPCGNNGPEGDQVSGKQN